MDTFIMIAQFVTSLSLLIILHELGHFIPARWFKTRVEKFYLFFDPYFSLFKKKIGDTEYGIGWLPLGGYVKISGMVDESMDMEQLKQEPQPWEFRSKPAWQRLIINAWWSDCQFHPGICHSIWYLDVLGRHIYPSRCIDTRDKGRFDRWHIGSKRRRQNKSHLRSSFY